MRVETLVPRGRVAGAAIAFAWREQRGHARKLRPYTGGTPTQRWAGAWPSVATEAVPCPDHGAAPLATEHREGVVRLKLCGLALLAGGALAYGPAPAATAVPVPSAHSAAVVNCRVFAYYPNVRISSARNMTCRAAAREMRRYKRPIYRRFHTPGGFRCYRVSGGPLGGQWRCVRRAQAFRFEFGD